MNLPFLSSGRRGALRRLPMPAPVCRDLAGSLMCVYVMPHVRRVGWAAWPGMLVGAICPAHVWRTLIERLKLPSRTIEFVSMPAIFADVF